MKTVNDLILHISKLGEVKNSHLLLDKPKSYTPKSVGVDFHLVIQYGLVRFDNSHYVRFNDAGFHNLIDFFNLDLSTIRNVFNEYYSQSYEYGLITNKVDFDIALSNKLCISNLESPVIFDILNGVNENDEAAKRNVELKCYIKLDELHEPTIVVETVFPYSLKENFIYRISKSASSDGVHSFSKIVSLNNYNHIKYIDFNLDDVSYVMFKKYFSQRMIQIIHANLGYSRVEIGKTKEEIIQSYDLMKMVKI